MHYIDLELILSHNFKCISIRFVLTFEIVIFNRRELVFQVYSVKKLV